MVATSNLSVRTRQRRLTQDYTNGLGFIGTLGLTQAFSEAVLVGSRTQSKQLQAIAQVFSRVQTDAGARTKIHARVAKLAQESTIAAYNARVVRREGPASATHYRVGAGRLAGGKMLDALSSPEFVEAGPDGINFGNIAVLNAKAAQWHRLNFGAAGSRNSAGGAATFEVSFNNLVVAALALDDGPSPGFSLPKGFFVSPEGNRVGFGQNPPGADLFFPKKSGAGSSSYSSRSRSPRGNSARQTAGIEARHFFDAGLQRIATELGAAYLQYYKDLYEDAKRGVGPLASQSGLVHPRALPVMVSRIEAD